MGLSSEDAGWCWVLVGACSAPRWKTLIISSSLPGLLHFPPFDVTGPDKTEWWLGVDRLGNGSLNSWSHSDVAKSPRLLVQLLLMQVFFAFRNPSARNATQRNLGFSLPADENFHIYTPEHHGNTFIWVITFSSEVIQVFDCDSRLFSFPSRSSD